MRPGADNAIAGEARPRLRHDVVLADTGDGVLIRTPDGHLVVKGPAAYPFAARLAPHLTGAWTVAELCSSLPDDKSRLVAAFVETLLEHGFARDTRSPRSGPRNTSYATQIDLIEHYRDDAEEAFLAFQNATIQVAGAGAVDRATANSLMRNGARNVTVITTPVEPLPADAVCGSAIPLETAPAPLVLPVLTHAGKALLGPATRPGGESCWNCLLLTLEVSESDTPLRQPQADYVGNALGTELFRKLTGIPTPTDGGVVVIDLDTLECTHERVLRHPSCAFCTRAEPVPVVPARAVQEPAAQFRAPSRLMLRALVGELDRSTSPTTGLLTGFHDTSVTQSPLKVGQVRTRCGRTITAFDPHHLPVARQRAVHAALLVHASRFTSGGVAEPAAPVPPNELLLWSGQTSTRFSLWLPMTSLLSRTSHFVPAAAVHPVTVHNNSGSFVRTGAGDGIGPTTAEATLRGLLTAFAHHSLGGTHEEIHLRQADLDPEIDFLLRTLAVLGVTATLTDLAPGMAHRVVRARSSDSGLTSIGAALSTRAATVSALRDLLGRIQLAREGVPFDAGNPLLSHPTCSIYAACALSADDDPAGLYENLIARGLDALAVVTTPSDVAQLGLVTVRVLLRRLDRVHRPRPVRRKT
ncbi:TOMM precursor leader peptide-binding protein [Actinokineospora cianjurensis]|uniref:Bacteriocin biosynthesis cyclodehydratase domain-containing protein n=1 Tax=Actinokineospora cianjurensis TaxID=585224 RepID=A0A421B594_9PSEU|nr:TOMM precursor leader peptide-binding protein [Actinokineospora cianjurensis]RLK59473.1 bacteriocin biosynthesis cyclodehydratase domain-containing protein [Actinokineospora cianjurensis]